MQHCSASVLNAVAFVALALCVLTVVCPTRFGFLMIVVFIQCWVNDLEMLQQGRGFGLAGAETALCGGCICGCAHVTLCWFGPAAFKSIGHDSCLTVTCQLHDSYNTATHSISTRAFSGNVLTANVARAGGFSGKYLP